MLNVGKQKRYAVHLVSTEYSDNTVTNTYPCPIFSYLVYFFLGSPMLTIVPILNKNNKNYKLSQAFLNYKLALASLAQWIEHWPMD